MRWLLDTNVVSETIQARPHQQVALWIARQSVELTAISVVTLAELREGASINPEERRRKQLADWIDVDITTWFAERILPLKLEVLVDWLAVGRRLRKQGLTRNSADPLIAATARVHNLIIVSRNVRDFAGTGVALYDPWNDEVHRLEPA
jgi:hypothetical protein